MRRFRHPFLPLWLLAVAFACVPQDAYTQPPPPDASNPSTLKALSIEQLSQIDVTTPSKEPVKAFQSPVAIYVIPGDQIRRSGATSIPEALRLAPGVEVARIDANKWSIGIRGFGTRFSRGVLVLIDGRTVYSTLLAGTYWEVQDTDMDDIDRIEVIRGPGGTIWGPNAVQGVINVITLNSAASHGLRASAGGGNEEQGFADVRYGGGNSSGFNYRVYAKGFTRGPGYHADHRNFDDWRSTQAGFRMDWDRSHGQSVTLQGDIYDETAGESVSAVSYTQPYSAIVDANALLSGGNVLGRWKKTFAGGNDIQVQAYFDRTNRHEPNFSEHRSTFDVDLLDEFKLPARQQISWGAGARFSRADDDEVVTGLTFVPAERTDRLITGFLQDQIGLVENRVSLVVGTKLLHTNFTNFQPEPSARLLWTPTEKQTFWTSFTHAVRTPSDAEEDFYLSGYVATLPNGTPYFARFNANDHFAPEQLNSTELGYRRLFGSRLAVDFAGFYNHYHNLFDEELTGPAFMEDTPAPPHLLLPAQFGNGLLGTTKGFELAPELRLAAFWQIRASYSFLQMAIRPAPKSQDIGTAPGINGSSPRHEAFLQSSFDLSKALALDLTYRYVATLPGQTVPSYSTADARFAWRFNRLWELSLAGRNLFQPHHPEDGGDPGPLVEVRRSGYIKLTWFK